MGSKIYYYPKSILNIVTMFINMFANISIRKYDGQGNIIDTLPVPILFGPITKTAVDRMEGPNSEFFNLSGVEQGQRYYITTPRMAVTLDGISYDASRATAANEWRYFYASQLSASNDVFTDYIPTPYNISCTLNIMGGGLDYMSQILEQILPYFNPAQILRIKEFNFLDIERDIPVKITSINLDQTGDQQDADTRHINGTIGFEMEAFLYRPFDVSGIITTINQRLFTV